LIYEGYKDAANVIDGLGMAPAHYLQWHQSTSLSLVPTPPGKPDYDEEMWEHNLQNE
jgi:hypothetical protein